MKNICKKIILISFILIITFSIPSFALYSEKLKVSPSAVQSVKFDEMVNLILGILTVIGVIVAVGGIIIIGIQTMVGSVEKRAVYKQKALPFLAGFVILLLALPIVNLIEGIITKNTYNASKPYSPKYKYDKYVTNIRANDYNFWVDGTVLKEIDNDFLVKDYLVNTTIDMDNIDNKHFHQDPIKVFADYVIEDQDPKYYILSPLDWDFRFAYSDGEIINWHTNSPYIIRYYDVIYTNSEGIEFSRQISISYYPDGIK